MIWMTMLYLNDPSPVDDLAQTYQRYGYPQNKNDVSMITRMDPPQVKYGLSQSYSFVKSTSLFFDFIFLLVSTYFCVQSSERVR
jgi:hypothetical protein